MSFIEHNEWKGPPGREFGLRGNEVHLWQLVADRNNISKLTGEEAGRCARIVDEGQRIAYATTQRGLRRIAARYRNCHENEIEFQARMHGKPYINGGPEFNLTHTAGHIVAAFSLSEVGIDIEAADRRVHGEDLARKFFAPAENARIGSHPAPERNRAFLRHWICKEAMVKLSGDGIYLGLRDANVEWDEAGHPHGAYRGRQVWLQEFSPAKGLLAALASWEPLELKCFFSI